MATGVVYGAPETLSVTCDTDLSLKAEYAAILDVSDEGNVDIAADATKFPFPIVEGAAGATGAKKVMTVAIDGCAKVKCGGSVLPGDKLTSDSAGKWVPTTTNGELYGAIALEAGATNDVIHVKVAQGVDNVAY
jgi:hypothetical protein